MNKHLKRIAASVSALCLAATFCSAISAGAVSLYPKTVMTKSATFWNKYANKNIKLEFSTSKEDYQDYLYEPGRGIKVVSTKSGPMRTIEVNYNNVLGLYNGSYDYWQAAQCALYNTTKAYDFFNSIGCKRGDITVAVNDLAGYTIHNTDGQRTNAWGQDGTLFFGMGSSDQSKADALKFLGSATDVVTHEYMHVITGDMLGWDSYDGKSLETCALMEAYSDIMAELADERGDWKVGATIFTNNNTSRDYSYRNLANPKNTKNPRTPGVTYQTNYGTWKKYSSRSDNPGADVAGSTVISHAAYLMHEMGYSNQTLGKIWLKSLSKYDNVDTNNVTFTDCRNAFEEAAFEVLGQTGGRYYTAQVFQLMTAFDEVGIY